MRRSRLGVEVAELSPQLAAYFGVKTGVLVSSVREGSPAETTGLKAGDVITAVSGHSVDDSGDLRRRIAETAEGSDATLAVTRDRNEMTMTVVLARAEGGKKI